MHHLWVTCRIRSHSTELSVRGKIEMRRLRYVDKSIYLSLAVMTKKARGLESHCGGPLRVLVRIWCRRGESNPRPRDYETLALPLSYAGPRQFSMLRTSNQTCQEHRRGSVLA